jgi:hypothetical protein
MFVRLLCGLAVVCSLACAADSSDDAAVRLARILASKGTITSVELSTVEAASGDQRVATLAAILERKGVLTETERAEVAPAATAPAPTQAVLPPLQPVTTARVPAATSATHVPLTFYGTLLMNAAYDTAPFNIEDIPLYALKQGTGPAGGDKSFAMTARQTRLGLRYEKPDVAGARLDGHFEFDLLGGKTPFGNGVDMDIFRLRLAYAKLQWKHFAFEAGQDWSIFAPLNPTSYAGYAIPDFSASGNPWIRLPQIRMEVSDDFAANRHLLWQLDAADPTMGDYSTASFSAGRTPGIGEKGRMPSLESRVALTSKMDGRDFTVGFSGHYGHGENSGTLGGATVLRPVDSWGVALDYSLPFSKHFNLTGEAFEGRALGIYSVTAGEEVGAVGTPGEHGVESRGGWIQAQFDFTKAWQVNLGYGLEVPNASELPVGNRWRNQTYMANLIYKLTHDVFFAWEYRRLITDYRDQFFADERGDHINLAVGFSF